MRFSSPELIAVLSTNTMSSRESFSFVPATKWSRNWWMHIRQLRYVSAKGLRAERRKPGYRTKLPTYTRSTSLLPEGCAQSYLDSAINRSLPFRFFRAENHGSLDNLPG